MNTPRIIRPAAAKPFRPNLKTELINDPNPPASMTFRVYCSQCPLTFTDAAQHAAVELTLAHLYDEHPAAYQQMVDDYQAQQ